MHIQNAIEKSGIKNIIKYKLQLIFAMIYHGLSNNHLSTSSSNSQYSLSEQGIQNK